MRARRIPSFFLTFATLIGSSTGCTGDTFTIAAPDRLALARAAADARAISGTCTTSFIPPTFPPPPVIRQVDEGICQISHLGRTAIYAVQDIDIVAGTQTSVEFTYTAANGDVLRVQNVGTNVPNGSGVRFVGTTTFVGGTGRFAGASGQARVEGAASFITNTASYTIDGWITYASSDLGRR